MASLFRLPRAEFTPRSPRPHGPAARHHLVRSAGYVCTFRATAGAALPTPSRPSASLAIVVLALLLSIQPVTTDLYLPRCPP